MKFGKEKEERKLEIEEEDPKPVQPEPSPRSPFSPETSTSARSSFSFAGQLHRRPTPARPRGPAPTLLAQQAAHPLVAQLTRAHRSSLLRPTCQPAPHASARVPPFPLPARPHASARSSPAHPRTRSPVARSLTLRPHTSGAPSSSRNHRTRHAEILGEFPSGARLPRIARLP